MTKKLSIIALMGLSVVLAGCSLPGTPDPQIVAQTQLLTDMQTQISTLLSGMDDLRTQNAQLSGALLKISAYVDAQTPTTAPTHNAPSLFDPSLMGTGADSTGMNVLELTVPQPSDLTGTVSTGENDISTGVKIDIPMGTGSVDHTWSIEVSTGHSITGSVDTGASSSTTKTSLLEELKKASKKSPKVSSGTDTSKGTGSSL